MALQFRDPSVAEKYEATTDKDIKKFCQVYHGMLSKVDIEGAAYLVKVKDPHIKEKVATGKKPAEK